MVCVRLIGHHWPFIKTIIITIIIIMAMIIIIIIIIRITTTIIIIIISIIIIIIRLSKHMAQWASDHPSHPARGSIQQRTAAMEDGLQFPCPNCSKVFGRKQHLRRHIDTGVCTRGPHGPENRKRKAGGVLEGSERTNFNLRRRMARVSGQFLEYTRATITLQSQYEGGPVDFIPLGGECIPRDLWALANCIRAAMSREGALASSTRVVAASAIVSLGWTDRWAAMVDLPPADPADPRYFQDLEAKLLIEWALQRPVFNAHVMAANTSSALGVDSRKVASLRISKFMEKVRGICTRAPAVADHLRSGNVNAAMEALRGPGIPVDGYTMKSTLSLWCLLGVCAPASFIGIDYPMGSGPLDALSHFVGQEVHGDMDLARRSLRWLMALVWQDWEANPPVVTLPVFNELQLQAVLCTWWAGGQQVDPAATVFYTMKAALLVQPAARH